MTRYEIPLQPWNEDTDTDEKHGLYAIIEDGHLTLVDYAVVGDGMADLIRLNRNDALRVAHVLLVYLAHQRVHNILNDEYREYREDHDQ